MREMIKKLGKTGFFEIIGSGVLNKIVTFLGNVILVHILTKSEYGVFTYVWNIYNMLLLANGLGVEAGALQLGSEYNHDMKTCCSIFGFAVRVGLLCDLFLAIILWLLGFLVPLKMQGANELMKLLCLLPAVQFLYSLSSVFLRTKKRNSEYARLTTLNTVLVSFFSIVGALLLKEKGLILGYYVAYFASVLFAFRHYGVELVQRKVNLPFPVKKDFLGISLTSMANNGLSQLMYLLDVFVLGIVAADEEILASYKVATTIPTALTFIPIMFVTYLYPYFAEHREDKKWCLEHYKKLLPIMGGINAMISGILYVLAPFLFRYLFGREYIDAIPIFRLLLLNYFISGTFRVISGNLLVTQRKLKFNLFVAIVSSSVNIIADYFLIGMWGSVGAAYATILVVLVSSILSTAYLLYILIWEK